MKRKHNVPARPFARYTFVGIVILALVAIMLSFMDATGGEQIIRRAVSHGLNQQD